MTVPKRDLLQEYLKLASNTDQNIRDTKPAALTSLEECEELIINIVFKGWREPGFVGLPLAFNAYYMFLASVRTAISGHPAAVFPTLRAALESACYALVIFDDTQLFSLWSNRHNDEAALKAQKKAFSGAVSQAAELAGKCDLHMADLVRALYEASIDYGGHPNPRTMDAHLKYGQVGFSDIDEFGCLYEPTDHRTGGGMVACLDFGIAIAYLLACPLKGPFSAKALVPNFNHLVDLQEEVVTLLRGSPMEYGEEIYSRFKKP